MGEYHHQNRGTCSTYIDFEIDGEGRLHNVRFNGGCNGNLKGIGRLVEGMDAREIAGRIRGVRCGMRATSCPDQLAQAIEEALEVEGK